MKKTLSIILAIIASLQFAFSQNVTINDPNFLAALINEGVDKDIDGIIQVSEAQLYSNSLFVYSKNISDLTGIEEFINLKNLDCSDNNLTKLDVSKNINLEFIYCGKNQLANLDLSTNIKLKNISCNDNKLTSLDVSKNINVMTLNCGRNQIANLDLSQNLKLDYLSCENNQLTILDLSKNTLLRDMICNGNNITDIINKNCTILRYFDCSANNIKELDISNNTNIETLYCYSNSLDSLVLDKALLLKSLACGKNNLDSLNLMYNTELSTINCGFTNLSKLDLRNNHKITTVIAANNSNLKLICLAEDALLQYYTKDKQTIISTTCVSSSPQTITFSALTSIKYSTQNYTLAATSSSGLPITYTSSNTSIATISGNVVTTTGVGTVTITASQAGNADFDKATDVTQLLEIVKDTSVISFDKLPNILFGAPTLQLNATSNNTQTNIVYESLNPDIATVSGNVVTILKVGTAQIKASQVGNANYVAAQSITQPLVVYAFQIITFDTIPTKTLNDESFVIQASTSSNLPLSYESTNKTVATVNGNIVTIVGIGETDIVVSQDGNDNYYGASVSQKLKVTQATAINEVNIENIEIYPNPSNGIIHVSNNQYFTDLKISNLNAETVFTSTLNESSFQTLDINTLPAGIYVIELSNGVAQQKSKLVICKN